MSVAISNVRLTEKGLFRAFLTIPLVSVDSFGQSGKWSRPYTPADHLSGHTTVELGYAETVGEALLTDLQGSDFPAADLDHAMQELRNFVGVLERVRDDYLTLRMHCLYDGEDAESDEEDSYDLDRLLTLPNVPDEIRAIFSPSRPLTSLQKFRLFHAAPNLNKEAA